MSENDASESLRFRRNARARSPPVPPKMNPPVLRSYSGCQATLNTRRLTPTRVSIYIYINTKNTNKHIQKLQKIQHLPNMNHVTYTYYKIKNQIMKNYRFVEVFRNVGAFRMHCGIYCVFCTIDCCFFNRIRSLCIFLYI